MCRWGHVLWRVRDTASPSRPTHGRCTFYDSIMAPEDIVPVLDGVFVASSDERVKHFMKAVGVEASPMGELFAIWNVDTPGQVRLIGGGEEGRCAL